MGKEQTQVRKQTSKRGKKEFSKELLNSSARWHVQDDVWQRNSISWRKLNSHRSNPLWTRVSRLVPELAFYISSTPLLNAGGCAEVQRET